jgi:hypothetical protein
MPVDCRSFPTPENVQLTLELQAKIQKEKEKLEAPWLGKLPFCVDTYGDAQYIDHDNIFVYMQNTGMSGCIIQFSPETYHPSSSNLDRLVRDICLVSRQQGVELVSPRGASPPICKTLVCSCSMILQPRGKKKQKDDVYHS